MSRLGEIYEHAKTMYYISLIGTLLYPLMRDYELERIDVSMGEITFNNLDGCLNINGDSHKEIYAKLKSALIAEKHLQVYEHTDNLHLYWEIQEMYEILNEKTLSTGDKIQIRRDKSTGNVYTTNLSRERRKQC